MAFVSINQVRYNYLDQQEITDFHAEVTARQKVTFHAIIMFKTFNLTKKIHGKDHAANLEQLGHHDFGVVIVVFEC